MILNIYYNNIVKIWRSEIKWYVVIIEDVEITNIDNGTTTTFNSNDFRYTLICTKKYGTKCNGVEKELLSIGSKAYGAGEVTALDGTTNKKQIYPADYLNISPKNNNEKKSMVYAFKNFQTDKLKYYLNYLKSGR